jgi:IS5 family transposase
MVQYLMFRRFIELSLSEAVSDHSTIWRFRQFLYTENLLEALLEHINHHLNEFCWVFFQDILGVLWLF